jgi:hypothetical protein
MVGLGDVLRDCRTQIANATAFGQYGLNAGIQRRRQTLSEVFECALENGGCGIARNAHIRVSLMW